MFDFCSNFPEHKPEQKKQTSVRNKRSEHMFDSAEHLRAEHMFDIARMYTKNIINANSIVEHTFAIRVKKRGSKPSLYPSITVPLNFIYFSNVFFGSALLK